MIPVGAATPFAVIGVKPGGALVAAAVAVAAVAVGVGAVTDADELAPVRLGGARAEVGGVVDFIALSDACIEVWSDCTALTRTLSLLSDSFLFEVRVDNRTSNFWFACFLSSSHWVLSWERTVACL